MWVKQAPKRVVPLTLRTMANAAEPAYSLVPATLYATVVTDTLVPPTALG